MFTEGLKNRENGRICINKKRKAAKEDYL